MKRVLVCDPMDEEALALLRAQDDLTVDYRPEMMPEALRAAIAACEAVFVRSRTKLTREALERAARLRVIGRAGTGVDNIDVSFARERGIRVLNTPGANANAVAELTLALLLLLARRIAAGLDSVRAGRPEKVKGVELRDKTLGLVGFGNIGRLVAGLARGFGMNVIAHDPLVSLDQVPEPLRVVPLCGRDELLARSDAVSLHTPALGSTRGMVDAGFLEKMQPGAFLINTARAELVDVPAVRAALEAGALGGYASDLPEGAGPLLAHPNVVVTPHIGAATREAQRRAGLGIVERVLEALREA